MEETDVNEQGSETQSEETTNNNAPAGSDFVVPEAYKDSGWASNIHSVDDLWTQHANAQKLIGKKTIGIPNADSSEQEYEDFYAKVRPENTDGYDFDLAEDTDMFKDIFYKNGISARQAKAITEAYKDSVRKASEGLYSQEGLDKAMLENVGDDYKNKVEGINKFLKQYAKPSTLKSIDNLPNEEIGLVYGIINLVMDKYGVKELGSVENKGDNKTDIDLNAYMNEMAKLDNDPFVTQEKRDAVRRKYGIIK